MFRNNQKRSMLIVIVLVNMLLFIQDNYAAPTVTIVVTPNVTEVHAGSTPIGLAAQAGGTNLTYEWGHVGLGELEGDPKSSTVFYRPPDKIVGESAQVIITVTVTDSQGERTSESKTFTIISKGMSTLTKTAIGVGAAAALGGGIYLLTRDDDNNDRNKCLDSREDWAYIHDPAYSGKVWIKITPRSENRNNLHYYRINWGPWVYINQIIFGGYDSVVLWHNKEVDEPTPLSFHIEPAGCVTFGTGEPSGDLIIDINEGWQAT